MKVTRVGLLAWALLCISALAHATLEYRRIALGLWGGNLNTSYVSQLREIQSLGANALLVPVLVYVDTMAGADVVYPLAGRTPPDASLRRALSGYAWSAE